MWNEFLIGAVLVGILLYTEREHMTGSWPPTDEESKEIFDRVMAIAPPILHDAYAEALALAQSALVEAKTLAPKIPDTFPPKAMIQRTSADNLLQYSKNGVAFAVGFPGRLLEDQGRPPTEENLRAVVVNMRNALNENIDAELPNSGLPDYSPELKEVQAKIKAYGERARTLVKKYNTPEVWDACVLVLKRYYNDQPTSAQVPSTAGSPDPTARGRILDLESEYQKRKVIYDNLVADALANNDASKIEAIASAKVAMSESLGKMLEVSAKSGTESQQDELIRRVMEIQREYNGLLVGTDKLQTLRLLHQSLDVRDSIGLKILGGAFLIAVFGLMIQIMRTS
jgi:hypothetical protein